MRKAVVGSLSRASTNLSIHQASVFGPVVSGSVGMFHHAQELAFPLVSSQARRPSAGATELVDKPCPWGQRLWADDLRHAGDVEDDPTVVVPVIETDQDVLGEAW